MSKINNSMEYYQNNQSLLSMLNKSKSGNPLINQLISNNEMKYQQKMEAMGFKTGKGNDKYKNVDSATDNLLDAIQKVSDKGLYTAEEGKELDKSALIKSVSNYVTAYNSTVTSLTNCGGALNKSFKTELEAAYKDKADAFAKLGIAMTADKKLEIDGDKLNAASVEDISALFGADSNYLKNIASSADSINTIVGKALAMSSSNYNSKGVTLF